MKQWARATIPVAVLACAFAGIGQQRKRPRAPKAATGPPQEQPNPRVPAIRANNIGLALMDRKQFADALGRFQTACILDTQSDVGCLNMGIAFLQMQRYDDARRVLTKSSSQHPQNPRAWFNLGLLDKAVDDPNAAIQDFEKVASLDASDAYAQYFLGVLYSGEKQYTQAITAFSSAVKLNPFFASAELGLAQVAQQTDDTDGALAHLTRFRRIVSENLGEPIRAAYGEQGKYSRAQDLPREAEDAPLAIPVHFVDVTQLSGLAGPPTASVAAARRNRTRSEHSAGPRIESAAAGPNSNEPSGTSLASFLGSGACIIDYNGDGKPDIFLVNADGKGNAALYRNAGHGKFVNETKAAKLEFHGHGTGCAVGDYDNDGHPDLAVSSNRGVTLYHNEGDGTFQDVTDAAGIRSDGLALGLTFIDYDHDGDLDLYVTRFNDFPLDHPRQPFSFPDSAAPGNILWRNKGNGTFMDWTRELALGGHAPSVSAIGSDVNNDRAIDLIVGGWRKSPTVFLNEPEGGFRAESPWATDMPGPTAGVASLDFDKDGWMDLAFTHWGPPGLSLWRNMGGKSFERVSLPGPEWMRGWGLAPLDYDNDGWVDLVAVGETFAGDGRIILLRNEGSKGFRDVTRETGLDKIELHDPRGVIACDFEGDGSADLLITENNRPPILLKNIGGNKNNWLQIALMGVLDSKTGIGTEAEIFAGAQRQKWEVPGASGYLGQGPAEILAGLGSENEVDVLRLFWPAGILQDDLQIRGGKRDVVTEFDPRDAQR
ncbi:MAG TPA: FG-GAP-like repeat-containing protein [Candidatus Acidoferrales bacterium]|nr:FG-GAP-like repeat-containing protein [Candidatus Acidoferrales bacterium]